MVDLHPLERALQILARLSRATLPGLGGEEKPIGITLQPRRNAYLRVAVARGYVNVVDVVLEEHVERAIGDILRDAAQCGGAEDQARALVACSAKGKKRDRHDFQA